MRCCGLEDTPSLMKLYNPRLQTEAVQKFYGFPRYIDNKGVSEQCWNTSAQQPITKRGTSCRDLQKVLILNHNMDFLWCFSRS